MSQPEQIEGFTLDGVSDGQRLCTGCWDKSNYDVSADNDIPEGEPIYWHCVSTMYGEWDAYCAKCAREFNETLETEAQLIAGLDTLATNS